MNRILLSILMIFPLYGLDAQEGPSQRRIDSLMTLIDFDNKKDTTYINHLIELGELFSKERDMDSAKSYFIQAKKVAIELEIPSKKLAAFDKLTRLGLDSLTYESIISQTKDFLSDLSIFSNEDLKSIGNIAIELNWRKRHREALEMLFFLEQELLKRDNALNLLTFLSGVRRDIYVTLKDYDNAKASANLALERAETSKDPELIKFARLALCWNHTDQENYSQAIESYQELLKDTLFSDEKSKHHIFEELSQAYFEVGQFELAESYGKQAIALTSDEFQKLYSMINILKATRKNASPSKVMSDMVRIEQLIKKHKAQYLVPDFLLEKGNFYFENQNYQEAIPIYELGLIELEKGTNTPYYKKERMQMLKFLTESYLAIKDFENATLIQKQIIKEKEKQISEEAQLKGIQYSANLTLEQNKNKQTLLEEQNKQQRRMLALAGFSLLSLIIFGIFAWRQSKIIAAEKQKSEDLLYNVIPPIVAKRMQKGEKLIVDKYEAATVVFIDLVGFTEFSSNSTPEEIIHLLNIVFSKMDQLTEEFKLEKIKTIGDCYMAVSGVPITKENHSECAIDFCISVMENLHGKMIDGHKVQLKIGIESGPVIAGVMGQKRLLFDLWGDAVNTASRMEGNGMTGKIQTTRKVYDKVKEKYSFEFRQVIDVKGKGEMEVYCL